MGATDVLRDLELLLLSRYPIIAVETYEEPRLEAALQAVTAKLAIRFYVWTLTEGLRRWASGSPIYDTHRPIIALGNLAAIRGDGVYYFKDLHRSLGEPEIVRKLVDLTEPFGEARRALVISAPRIQLPVELEKLVARIRLERAHDGGVFRHPTRSFSGGRRAGRPRRSARRARWRRSRRASSPAAPAAGRWRAGERGGDR
jgi:hypothetical protein